MFGKKKASHAAINTLVGSDTRVHGDVEFTGGFLVDGYVKGNVKATGGEHSTLSISERGCIEGAVVVPHVLLNGTVKGDVRATEKVELGPKARVIGNVQYQLIEMAIGAEVNGKLIHESEGERAQRAVEPGRKDGEDADADESRVGAIASVNVVGE
jgi:cytoskeletal protein CcmA (bactofilin family)